MPQPGRDEVYIRVRKLGDDYRNGLMSGDHSSEEKEDNVQIGGHFNYFCGVKVFEGMREGSGKMKESRLVWRV